MATSLVSPEDLDGFPGAPFTYRDVAPAAASVQRIAGWHIAPSVTETLRLDSDGGTRLVLPTLRLTAVTAVRDVRTADAPVALTGFRWSSAGVLFRACCWPAGFQAIEVDVVHGYDECPPELLPTVADACRRANIDGNLASRTTGPFSESYRDSKSEGVDPALARYTLPSRP